jgi:hypothetical protein
MLTPANLIRLPYTPDLTEGGIAYACRSLAYTYNRMGGSPVDRLRRIVGGVAVELAFRRHLGEQEVPFDVLGATPFTDPDHYDVSLGGHRCDLKSYLITRRRQISLIRKDPSLLMDAPALIPVDQFTAEGHSSQDIYLFAFLLALTTPSMADIQKALAAGQPAYLIHPLPEEWARPRQWQLLEKLALKSECEQAIPVEIGGMDSERNFVTVNLELPPRQRTPIPKEIYSVAYIHASQLPEARLGIHSPLRGAAYIVQPHEWGNIWVYGMEIWLAGWLTYEEYRRKASVLPVGSHTFQYSQTRTKNLAVSIKELKPLEALFERIRQWAAARESE